MTEAPAVVFFDPLCPEPYDTRTLNERAIAGTEASVVRVADGLNATVVQHNRQQSWGRYQPLVPLNGVHSVVIVRDPRALGTVNTLYPGAKVYIWLHDRFGPRSSRGRWLARTAPLLRTLQPTLICVSHWQQRHVDAALEWIGVKDHVRTVTLYNPIGEVAADPRATVDDRKLVFFSSPNKGLAYVIDVFRAMRRAMPDLRLVVGNPGYKNSRVDGVDGVEYLGPRPQAQIHAEVGSALCTFHPGLRVPETFGLVFAESKALGTPILTHDSGAASEIIDDPSQILPVTPAQRAYAGLTYRLDERYRKLAARSADRLGLFESYIERIKSWRAGARPQVSADPRFQLNTVLDEWRELLDCT